MERSTGFTDPEDCLTDEERDYVEAFRRAEGAFVLQAQEDIQSPLTEDERRFYDELRAELGPDQSCDVPSDDHLSTKSKRRIAAVLAIRQ